jgi:3-phenylpropionate/trans-cinnamate dioxygenase ferredoxin reductase subunit
MTKNFDYVIVGGGMTADSAVRGIRELDKQGSIAVVSNEKNPPYNRPPLSKKLWTGKPLDSIWRHTADLGAQIVLNTTMTSGDPLTKVLVDANGEEYTYKKLLLATGGFARPLPAAPEGIIYFRTLEDYKQVRSLADRKSSFIIIGGGFIGSEIAAALAMNGCKVTMVFPDSGIGAKIYPAALSHFLNQYFADKGVSLLPGERVQSITRQANVFSVTTQSGKSVSAEAVIAGIGLELNLGLAHALKLQIENGIVVNEYLQTSVADIYSAGDVANAYNSALGTRRRVEHEDNANTMGSIAGKNMAGAKELFDYLPYFYTDLFDLGYEAVGEFGAAMQVVEDWQEPFRKGVLYYLKDDRVRGVLLWNTWGQVAAARTLIAEPKKYAANELIGKIHD